MSVAKWNERYRAGEQVFATPAPLVVKFARELSKTRGKIWGHACGGAKNERFEDASPECPQIFSKGVALDLACGPGRNALYLAELGWRVTAVDGSPIAIDILRKRAAERGLEIETKVADLERGEFEIQPGAYDLVCDCYFLQRDLITKMQAGLRPGGLIISIVHLSESATPTRAYPGELRSYFDGWTILHYYEGMPQEACHQRAVAELVARKS